MKLHLAAVLVNDLLGKASEELVVCIRKDAKCSEIHVIGLIVRVLVAIDDAGGYAKDADVTGTSILAKLYHGSLMVWLKGMRERTGLKTIEKQLTLTFRLVPVSEATVSMQKSFTDWSFMTL